METAQHSLGSGDQLNLFHTEIVSVDASFSTVRRIWLDPESWIDFVPGWLSGSDVLFSSLRDSAAWEQRARWMYTKNVIEPRLTAEYSDVADTPDVFLRTVARTLSLHYDVLYKRVWMNLYRDNQDGTSWHADRLAKQDHEAIIPVLSLGATRRFLIRPISGGQSTVLAPAGGDLVVMGGRCQRDWQHSVPKQKTPAGSRISLNFQASHDVAPQPARLSGRDHSATA
jgi:alkylated DNA repair dioxygenase AlkB